MARFTQITYNTGSIASGGHHDSHQTIPSSKVNIGKVKVVPSGSSIGYYFEIYKKDTFLAGDRHYSTLSGQVGNFYDPTDRNGNEVLEGFVLPYEDLDATNEIHIRVTNQDTVSRSYQVTIWYEDATANLASSFVMDDLSSQLPASSLTLTYTPVNFLGLFRGGLLQTYTADYTRSGTTVTLVIPGTSGEIIYALYVK